MAKGQDKASINSAFQTYRDHRLSRQRKTKSSADSGFPCGKLTEREKAENDHRPGCGVLYEICLTQCVHLPSEIELRATGWF